MLIRFGYDIEFFCAGPVVMLTQLDAHPELDQRIIALGPLATEPPLDTSTFVDAFGNEVRRFLAPAGLTRITRDCVYACDGAPQEVAPNAREVPLTELPPAYFTYLVGSRYCEVDRMSALAWQLFGNTPRGWARVQAICDFVERHLTFGYQFARATRTACEAFEERVGVCRDFAHLAVTLCRCMNIPARYANGFMGNIGVSLEPHEDYNAWFEAYLDNRWFIFDARHNTPRIGRITVARGRDAADIPLTASFGPHDLVRFRVWTDELPASAVDGQLAATAAAVTISADYDQPSYIDLMAQAQSERCRAKAEIRAPASPRSRQSRRRRAAGAAASAHRVSPAAPYEAIEFTP